MARVLIAEDDPDIRALVARRVTQLGHEVLEVLDGQAALDIALAAELDLVLLDWMMPTHTGLDVCRAIRADARVGRMKIVMLTAKAHEDDLARAFSAGVDDYVIKPFRGLDLQQRLSALLDAR
ncbi:MAG: response regulator [Microcella sp.]|uniref:response regulator transcription factor n=1 Tax=Microcella sp. TaxID=1913979 RepID=UPI0027277D09|nr:response regulator [Microcella sp.]MDO8338727.1 response regulator [Microcella sp.]